MLHQSELVVTVQEAKPAPRDEKEVARIFQQIAQQQRRLNAMRERTAQEYPEFAGDILFAA